MQTLAQPVKLWWYGPLFRHERPQAGRFRQFNQIDAEAIGSDSPLVDAELIVLLDELLRDARGAGARAAARQPRLARGARRLSRRAARLPARARVASSARDVRERIDENPLRAFDSKDEGTRGGDGARRRRCSTASTARTPSTSRPCRSLLDRAGVAYDLDPTLVRGLDYYTRTVFEFHCDRLGAQSQVAGGGRYDGLIELLGGPPTPACGWAAGVERILLALEGEQEPRRAGADVFVAAADGRRERALALVIELRRAGLRPSSTSAAAGSRAR